MLHDFAPEGIILINGEIERVRPQRKPRRRLRGMTQAHAGQSLRDNAVETFGRRQFGKALHAFGHAFGLRCSDQQPVGIDASPGALGHDGAQQLGTSLLFQRKGKGRADDEGIHKTGDDAAGGLKTALEILVIIGRQGARALWRFSQRGKGCGKDGQFAHQPAEGPVDRPGMDGRRIQKLLQLGSVAAEDAEYAEQGDAVQGGHAGNARVTGNNLVFLQLMTARQQSIPHIVQQAAQFGCGVDVHAGRGKGGVQPDALAVADEARQRKARQIRAVVGAEAETQIETQGADIGFRAVAHEIGDGFRRKRGRVPEGFGVSLAVHAPGADSNGTKAPSGDNDYTSIVIYAFSGERLVGYMFDENASGYGSGTRFPVTLAASGPIDFYVILNPRPGFFIIEDSEGRAVSFTHEIPDGLTQTQIKSWRIRKSDTEPEGTWYMPMTNLDGTSLSNRQFTVDASRAWTTIPIDVTRVACRLDVYFRSSDDEFPTPTDSTVRSMK